MAHEHQHTHGSTGNIKVAFFLNLAFTVFEIIGGIWTNSLAITSDALHDLGDSFSLGLSWYLENYAQRGKSERYSYGYRRFSLLGALSNVIILIVGGLFVLSQAIPRLLDPEPSNAQGMVLFAIVGVVVNGLAALQMRGSHGFSARTVTWHLIEDVLGWMAVLIVSVVLLFTDLHILDPILSVLITLYVLYNALRGLHSMSALFLQAVPEHVSVQEIEEQLRSIDQVQSTHHTHIWSLDGEHHVLTTHVVVDADTTKEEILEIKRQVKALTDRMELVHVTVEVEYEDEDCRISDLTDCF